MTATEHMAAARDHSDRITGAHGHGYTPAPYFGGSPWGHGYGYGSYPWYYSWDPDEEHRALATAHRDAAEQLQVQYEAACTWIPRGLEARSPLEAFTTSTSTSNHAIVFHLADRAGPPELVLAQLRCHRAWLALAPNAGAADNPLLVEGVTWMAHARADGVDVMATAREDRAGTELARRAALLVARAQSPAR